MNAKDAINLARKHVIETNNSSGEVALGDSIACYDRGDFEAAKKRALDSLRYTVGVFHKDFEKVRKG